MRTDYLTLQHYLTQAPYIVKKQEVRNATTIFLLYGGYGYAVWTPLLAEPD